MSLLQSLPTRVNKVIWPFLNNCVSMNWLQKIAGWVYLDDRGNRTPCVRSPNCDGTSRSRRWLMRFPDGDYMIPRNKLVLDMPQAETQNTHTLERQKNEQFKFNW